VHSIYPSTLLTKKPYFIDLFCRKYRLFYWCTLFRSSLCKIFHHKQRLFFLDWFHFLISAIRA